MDSVGSSEVGQEGNAGVKALKALKTGAKVLDTTVTEA